MGQQFNPAGRAFSKRLAAPIFGVATLVVAMTSLQGDARASRPQECRTGSGRDGYDAGYNLQRNLLEFIWRTSFDCNTLEDFIRAVSVEFDPSASSTYLACRNAGIADAIRWTIGDVQTSCVIQCAANGSDIGELNGKIYCGVPRTFSLTAELRVCDLVSEQACRSSFTSYANTHCRAKKETDPNFDEFLGYACAF